MEVYFKRQSIAENCGKMMVGEWLGRGKSMLPPKL